MQVWDVVDFKALCFELQFCMPHQIEEACTFHHSTSWRISSEHIVADAVATFHHFFLSLLLPLHRYCAVPRIAWL